VILVILVAILQVAVATASTVQAATIAYTHGLPGSGDVTFIVTSPYKRPTRCTVYYKTSGGMGATWKPVWGYVPNTNPPEPVRKKMTYIQFHSNMFVHEWRHRDVYAPGIAHMVMVDQEFQPGQWGTIVQDHFTPP
jgi:hypothetical protein